MAKSKSKRALPHTPVSTSHQPKIVQSLVAEDTWLFSFKYFKQIDSFGVDGVSKTWFVSFLEKLKEFSSYSKDRFNSDKDFKRSQRYHEINWESPNVPIKRSDLSWIDKEIIDNEEEFPFFQFHISKALGRIVGFWDYTGKIFQIVLLDPMHNIQPSKYNSYQINDAYPLSCEFSSLLVDIETSRKQCVNTKCPTLQSLDRAPLKRNDTNIVLCSLDNSFYEKLQAITNGKTTISDILELGIMAHKGV